MLTLSTDYPVFASLRSRWLPPEDDEPARISETRTRCVDMLMVADGLIAQLATHRKRSGIDLHGRIGISLGSTESGVLGRLQPRFVVFGEAMSAAAELEQTGVKDAAHCSVDFLECIRRRAADHDASPHVPSGMEGMTQVHPMIRRAATVARFFNLKVDNAGSKAATEPDAGHQGGPASTSLDAAREQVVERMLAEGKLLVQQNMMEAQPDALAMATLVQCRDKLFPECEQFGLRTTLSSEGNFVANWFGHMRHALRRSVDSNGMLRPVSQICLGVSTERNEEIREEATALGIGWGKGEGSKIGATTSEEEEAQETDILSSQEGADEEVLSWPRQMVPGDV